VSRPNILFISTDQQHYTALGVTDPHPQDAGARPAGARGDALHTRLLSQPDLLTDARLAHHRAVSGLAWLLGDRRQAARRCADSGRHFQAHGYRSILVGKAHFQPLKSAPGSESIECQPTLRDLEFWRNFAGPWYGFDHIETARMHANEWLVGQHYALWMEEKGLTNWRDYFQTWPPDPNDKYAGPYYMRDALHWDLPEEFHHTHWIGERTIANIEQCAAQDQPFFLWASFFDPHPPYVVPEPWASMYDPADMQPGHYVEGEFAGMPPHFARTREQNPD
jgi:arylsulfatase A-like enzyme